MGNRIRELRAERGLTLANLANNTGLAPNTISQYETGKRNPKLETWIK
ncbi:helix-turn-helix transcriptional regulator, partial [uncultured Ligilactobacillus sp.]